MYSQRDVKVMRRTAGNIRADLALDGPLATADWISLVALFPDDTPADVAVALAELWMDRQALARELEELTDDIRIIADVVTEIDLESLVRRQDQQCRSWSDVLGRLYFDPPDPLTPSLRAVVTMSAPHGPDLSGVPVAA